MAPNPPTTGLGSSVEPGTSFPPESDTLAATPRQLPVTVGVTAGQAASPSGRYRPPVANQFQPRYEFKHELARGGMGAVWQAHDKALRRDIAVKVMLSATPSEIHVSRFVQEAQVTGQLEHPAIVPVYELGRDSQNRWYIAMKLIRGQSLKTLLNALHASWRSGRGDGGFSLPKRLEVFQKICDAIAFAHSRRVIHRDLKPENVMVGEFGEVQVMDWGLAKILPAEREPGLEGTLNATLTTAPEATELSESRRPVMSDSVERTLQGQIAGTPAYMPPEQANGQLDKLGVTSDVYSLGAILYELLTATPPYRGPSAMEILSQVRHRPVEPPARRIRREFGRRAPGVPRELNAIVLKAMARDPRRRYRGVADLRRDVDAYVANESVVALPDSLARRLVKWVRRHPTLFSLSVLGLIAALTVGLLVSVLQTQVREAELREMRQARDSHEKDFRQRYAAARKAGKYGKVVLDEIGLPLTYSALYTFESTLRKTGGAIYDAQDFANMGTVYAVTLNDWANAERLYRRALELDPNYVDAHDGLGQVLFHRGDLVGALRSLERAVELAPQDRDARTNLATVLNATGATNQALNILDAVIAQWPTFAAAYAGRAVANRSANNPDGALADANKAIELDPNSTISYITRANAYWDKRDLPQALASINRAIELDPTLDRAWFARAAIRHAAGEFHLALLDASEAIRLMPTAANYDFRARIYRSLRNYPLAEADVAKALELNPKQWSALNCRALIHKEQGRMQDALADLNACIAITATPDTLANRGSVRGLLNDHAGAFADFEAALKIDPRHYGTLVNKGNTHRRLGQSEAAIAAYSQAIAIEPTMELLCQRASLYLDRGDTTAALDDIQAAARLGSLNGRTLVLKARILFRRGDLAMAAADLAAAAKMPDALLAEVYATKCAVSMTQGLREQAETEAITAVTLDATVWPAWWILGQVQLERGSRAEGIRSLERAYRLCSLPAQRQAIAQQLRAAGARVPAGD